MEDVLLSVGLIFGILLLWVIMLWSSVTDASEESFTRIVVKIIGFCGGVILLAVCSAFMARKKTAYRMLRNEYDIQYVINKDSTIIDTLIIF